MKLTYKSRLDRWEDRRKRNLSRGFNSALKVRVGRQFYLVLSVGIQQFFFGNSVF